MMSLCAMAPTLDILDSLLDHGRNWRFLFIQLLYYLWAEPVKFLFFLTFKDGKRETTGFILNTAGWCWFHLHQLTCSGINCQRGLYLLCGPAALKLAVTLGVHFSVLSYWMWISFWELNLKLFALMTSLICTTWSRQTVIKLEYSELTRVVKPLELTSNQKVLGGHGRLDLILCSWTWKKKKKTAPCWLKSFL